MPRRPLPRFYGRVSRRWLIVLLCWWSFMMVVITAEVVVHRNPVAGGLLLVGVLAMSDLHAALRTKPRGRGRP